MKKKYFLSLIVLLHFCIGYSQSTCAFAVPVCFNPTVTVAATTSTPQIPAQTGPNYGCLFTVPNPTWLYFKLQTAGSLDVLIQGTIGGGPGPDVDFICWGPFSTLANACNSLTAGKIVDCSYSGSPTETLNITNGIAGDFYIMLVTNFSNVSQDIVLSQYAGTATTACSIACITGTISPTVVNNPQQTSYTVNASINFTNAPQGGTLFVTNSCSGETININPPFISPTAVSFTPLPLTASPANCAITAWFSNVPSCSISAGYLAAKQCSIGFVSAIPNATTFTSSYILDGTAIFSSAPSTGSFVIIDACSGQTVSFSAPFSSPIIYNFPQDSSTGGSVCSVITRFTAANSCSFVTYYFSPYNVTGIDNRSIASEIFIYPTVFQTSEMLHINNWQKFEDVKIYSVDGKLLLNKQPDKEGVYIDIDQFQNSVYFILLENKNPRRKYYQKIVILKE